MQREVPWDSTSAFCEAPSIHSSRRHEVVVRLFLAIAPLESIPDLEFVASCFFHILHREVCFGEGSSPHSCFSFDGMRDGRWEIGTCDRFSGNHVHGARSVMVTCFLTFFAFAFSWRAGLYQ